MQPRFHLAFPVDDLAAARAFYGGVLGCKEGRSSAQWVDFDFHGHQIVAHLSDEAESAGLNAVDAHAVPVRHFGLILPRDDWDALVEKFERAGVEFVIAPYLRFEGKAGEQGTMFVKDPSGNALEFKTFRDEKMIFDKGTDPLDEK